MVSRLVLRKKSSHFLQSGQVALVTLLIMVVLLTMGLSIAQQTSLSLFDTQVEQSSTQALNAAEDAIEEALADGLTPGEYSQTVGGVEVDYTVTSQQGIELFVQEGNAVSLDVSGAGSGDSLLIQWSFETNCSAADREEQPASLLYTIVYDDSGTQRATHGALGGCDRGDGLGVITSLGQGNFYRRASINLDPSYEVVRLRPIYNNTNLKVESQGSSGWTLTDQGFTVRSQARSQTDEVRTVEVNVTEEAYPSVFDYALYSGSTIVK